MAEISALKQVREGMEVRCCDGKVLGRVQRVWFGTDTGVRHSLGQMVFSVDADTEDADLPPGSVPDAVVEVKLGSAGTGETVYVPHQAVAKVSDDAIDLRVALTTAERSAWSDKPSWMEAGVTT